MNSEILIAKLFIKTAFKNKAVFMLMLFVGGLLLYAAFSGWSNFKIQNEIRSKYQEQSHKDWLSNPDKHPHRMAHYGNFAFRPKSALSAFDFGMESYFGNVIYLEAHKQNTVNFSEAGFSTGMLRFGEISIAMILQILLPLLIFFLGFGSIASERENGTLKILLSQGLSWKQLILGKSLGIIGVVMTLFIPVVITLILLWLILQNGNINLDETLRLLLIILSYFVYLVIFCVIAVLISAISKSTKTALTSLIGIWLLLTIVLPRASQALGSYIYTAPSKMQFNAEIEKDILKVGDSHNPNDPYFKTLKDSLLTVYKVDSVQKSPLNYGGFQMKEGEKISATIYNQHFDKLLTVYKDQNSFSKVLAFLNPFLAIKNLSMALSGTDYKSYINFQQQAEESRYEMAQKLNDLQIKYISNKAKTSAGKANIIDKNYWADLGDFHYKPTGIIGVFKHEFISIIALFFWIGILIIAIKFSSKNLKAI